MSLGPCEIFEVGPRDGLQNEKREISVADKVALVNRLSDAGFSRIECASFVSPKWVPQMAGSGEVLAQIRRAEGVRYAALTPNMRGYEDARAAKADEISVFASASEGFSQKNINASIAESLERFAPVLEEARHLDIPVRGYVSCVIDCPYDGPVAPGAVADIADKLFAMGCYEISLGDTIGAGTPDSIAKMGGCPFAPGAAGNVATEAVNKHLTALGYKTGLDQGILIEAAEMARAMRR
jgi:hydroxymethylglutaryl-CoA lyase